MDALTAEHQKEMSKMSQASNGIECAATTNLCFHDYQCHHTLHPSHAVDDCSGNRWTKRSPAERASGGVRETGCHASNSRPEPPACFTSDANKTQQVKALREQHKQSLAEAEKNEMRKKLETLENDQKRKLDQQARRVQIVALLCLFDTLLPFSLFVYCNTH